MGYSHYMTFPYHRESSAFASFIEDARKIIECAPNGAELCAADRYTEPIINNEMLILGSKTTDNPFSVLRIASNQAWPAHRYPILTVRTDKHVYDSVICACLLAFVHHFPSSMITTDGSEENWSLAMTLYEYATERKAPEIDFQNR